MKHIDELTPLEALLEELDADLHAWEFIGLYEFSWFLRGLERGLTEEQMAQICLEAYEDFIRRHAVHLRWFDWPPDRSAGRRAEPGTTPDFDINTRGEIDSPFLALVPDATTP